MEGSDNELVEVSDSIKEKEGLLGRVSEGSLKESRDDKLEGHY